MDDYKFKALMKLKELMKVRMSKKLSPYQQGAKLSGMSGYLPDMKDGCNMEEQRQKLKKQKPYDRIEKK